MSQHWFPQQLKTILNRDHLTISLSEEVGHNQIKDNLLKSQYVGLTTFNEEAPMNIVCLTTDQEIYVFNLDKPQDKKFLKEQLKNEKIDFFMTNGSYNAVLFHEKIGICLYNYSNIIDLTVLDLLNRLNRARIINRDYTYKCELINEKGPIQFYYEQLVVYCLGADKLDLSYSDEELLALNQVPINNVAKNLIMKRASLKRALGEKLMMKFNETLDSKHYDLKSFRKRATSELMLRYENERDGSYNQFCQYLQLCPEPTTL